MKFFSYCLPLSLLMITGTSASASVIISFQGTSATGNIDPELNWTLDITVDNGGGGSITNQHWFGTDITEVTITRGSYQFTSNNISGNGISVQTLALGEIHETLIIDEIQLYGIDLHLNEIEINGGDMWTSEFLQDYHTTPTMAALSEPQNHTGWSVSPMSNPAVPEPTSAIVWACLLTVGCLGKRSFYSLSNRSRPKSTNV